MFAIRSSEVFALGGDLLYIFYGSCSGAFGKFAGERLFARQRFAYRGSTVVEKVDHEQFSVVHNVHALLLYAPIVPSSYINSHTGTFLHFFISILFMQSIPFLYVSLNFGLLKF